MAFLDWHLPQKRISVRLLTQGYHYLRRLHSTKGGLHSKEMDNLKGSRFKEITSQGILLRRTSSETRLSTVLFWTLVGYRSPYCAWLTFHFLGQVCTALFHPITIGLLPHVLPEIQELSQMLPPSGTYHHNHVVWSLGYSFALSPRSVKTESSPSHH